MTNHNPETPPSYGQLPNTQLPQYHVENYPQQVQHTPTSGYQQPAPQPPRTPWGKIVLTIAFLLMVFFGGFFGAKYFFGSAATEMTSAFIKTITGATTSSEQESGGKSSTPETSKTTSSAAQLPEDAVPVNAAARNGTASKPWQSVYKSGNTSDEFANSVHSAYLDRYNEPPTGLHTLEAYSPVTRKNYTMRCEAQGQLVHCQGGNNAHVYIR